MESKQIGIWTGEFGREYTERNRFLNAADFNALYENRYGRARDDINLDWLGHLPRDIRILEVGANVGNQLQSLQRIGFQHLFGIEIQRYCIEKVKQVSSGIDIIEASVFDIPFKNGWLDLVFTNNVLIHVAPDDLPRALSEIIRVSGKYILGFEYFSEKVAEIPYHGHANLLWKADYRSLYQRACPTLKLLREEKFPYLDESGNVDNCFLLSKP